MLIFNGKTQQHFFRRSVYIAVNKVYFTTYFVCTELLFPQLYCLKLSSKFVNILGVITENKGNVSSCEYHRAYATIYGE